MCSVSCDSFKNPEIQKIKAEVERQNIEKEAVKQQAVEKALELFERDDVSSLEQHFFSEEVAVFKDKKTGVCLPMLFNKKSKEWKSFGFIKGSVLYIKDIPLTFGDYINYGNLETLVEKHCDVDKEYLKHRDRLIEKEEQEKKNIDKKKIVFAVKTRAFDEKNNVREQVIVKYNDDTEGIITDKEEMKRILKKDIDNYYGIGDGSPSNFEQIKYWRQKENVTNMSLTKWSNISKKPMDLEAAEKYCENLVEQGWSDWRLPMLGELRSLVTNCFNTEFLGPCRMRDYQFQNYLFWTLGTFGPGSRHLGIYCIDDSRCACSCYTDHCKGCEPAEDGRYSRFGDRVALHSLNGTIDFKNAKILRLAVDDDIPLTFVRCIRGETSLELDEEYYYKKRLKERLDFNRKMEHDDEKN